MPTTDNGWPVLTPLGTRSYGVPRSNVKFRLTKDRDAADVLVAVAEFVDQNVEDLDTRKGMRGYDVMDDWSFARRNVRGATSWSRHAAGIAIDANAVQHPLGVSGTWTAAQKREINGFLAQLDGVVRWGENYQNRKDGMHFEIDVPHNTAGRAKLARVAASVRGQRREDDPAPGLTRGRRVQLLQQALLLPSDGVWGPTTDARANMVRAVLARGARPNVRDAAVMLVLEKHHGSRELLTRRVGYAIGAPLLPAGRRQTWGREFERAFLQLRTASFTKGG